MDWPTAALLLAEQSDKPETYAMPASLLSAAIVTAMGMYKYVPRRVLNGKGERLATREQLADLAKDVEEQKNYTHEFVHDTRSDFMQPMAVKMALLEERVGALKNQIEDRTLLGDKLDLLHIELKRNHAVMESALVRTYKQNNP